MVQFTLFSFVERANRTVDIAIRCYVEQHTKWDKQIHNIQQAINTSKNEAIFRHLI